MQDAMRKNLEETWDKLKGWLMYNGSNEIANFCDRSKGLWPGGNWPGYMELLCQPILEIKYFISGIKTARDSGSKNDVPPTYETVDNVEAYKRCLVGTVALSEIYGDHCKLKDVIGKVEGQIMDKVKAHYKEKGKSVTFHECKGKVDGTTLMLAKSLLQDKIKQWTEEKRKSNEGWRVGSELWGRMKMRCTNSKNPPQSLVDARKKEWKESNKGSTAAFLGVKSDDKRSEGALMSEIMEDDDKFSSSKLGEMLKTAVAGAITSGNNIDVDRLVQSIKEGAEKTVAQECMKDNSNDFCQRLQCAQKHWELRGQQKPGQTQGSSSN
ncbi:SICAvar, type I (fragment), partial [Plasmodium knowlesi strain H]